MYVVFGVFINKFYFIYYIVYNVYYCMFIYWNKNCKNDFYISSCNLE